jgi:phosphoenolpyruvate carboxylase
MRLLYDSMMTTGDDSVANGALLDLLRQLATFGLCVMQLDIRQESTRHAEVLECITDYLGLGSYGEWSEEQRCAFLLAELQGRRPLLPPGMDMNADVKEVVDTFRWVGGASWIRFAVMRGEADRGHVRVGCGVQGVHVLISCAVVLQ